MIQPLKNYILIKREEDEITTKSGIVISVSDDKQQYHGVYGRVIAIGPDVASRRIREGARVIVNRYDTLPLRDGAQTVEMLKEDLVYGVVTE